MAPNSSKGASEVATSENVILGDIERLNALVKRKLEAGGKGVEPEASRAVKDGAQVYHRRYKSIVVFFMGVCAFLLWNAPTLSVTVWSLVLMWFMTDLYGAVLHVVLDHPAFIRAPIISTLIAIYMILESHTTNASHNNFGYILASLFSAGPACLEFQWHHSIPTDIVSKNYLEVCGDLNLVVTLHMAWHAFLWGGFLAHPAAGAVAGAKISMAYLGQWAHRMAHAPESKRPLWVKAAQAVGILVHPSLHHIHHTNYDDGFPILSGFTAPLVKFLLWIMPDRRMWLVLFLVLSLTDIWAMSHVVSYLSGVPL